MTFGSIVMVKDCTPGDRLIRNSEGNVQIAFVTGIQSQGERLVLSLSSHPQLNGSKFPGAFRDPMWKVTEFTQLRPDMTTQEFSSTDPKDGQVFVAPDGSLVMCATQKDSYAQIHPRYFDIASGQEVPVSYPFSMVRFTSWRLVTAAEDGSVAALFKWPIGH